MSWTGSSPIQMMRTYAVQRGAVIMVLQFIENPGQAPAYDGSQDIAALNNITDRVCTYAGACPQQGWLSSARRRSHHHVHALIFSVINRSNRLSGSAP